MVGLLQQFWRLFGRAVPQPAKVEPSARASGSAVNVLRSFDIAPNDPLLGLLQSAPGVVDISTLKLASPMVQQLRTEGVRLLVPLLSHGALVGVLSLGPRRSEQEYSSDDLALLTSLATQAAPALRVAQLVRQQQIEARERERVAQELRVARLIQQTLLPRAIPDLAGWQVVPYYEPAREVGGDFYDFIELGDGRIGLVIADVTDKGVPAALVMAMTRSILRAAAGRIDSPGAVLARVNEVLCPDMPPNMFVTCLYAVLEPQTGRLRFANAGHDLPYWRNAAGVTELRARGMPLGLMPGMFYEEHEVTLASGDQVLFYSDGLVEAHDPQRTMFSFGRLARLLAGTQLHGQALVDYLMNELSAFTGPQWVQEDDITLVAFHREAQQEDTMQKKINTPPETSQPQSTDNSETKSEATIDWDLLAQFEIPSVQDNERLAMERVGQVVAMYGLEPIRLERLKTAVAETTMNAMEHGNRYDPNKPVQIHVLRSTHALAVRIFDQGGSTSFDATHEEPDLDAKLEGLQTPRGWGLYLIEHMVDEMNITRTDGQYMVELVMKLTGGQYA
jgi:serine phosphatase RsbU (regulator of sigma subunit)/anti-sigma regulatory factor (Ser/Thr protein kinase)